jgi:hypothetical protein
MTRYGLAKVYTKRTQKARTKRRFSRFQCVKITVLFQCFKVTHQSPERCRGAAARVACKSPLKMHLRQTSVADSEHLRMAAERLERCEVGARHPGLQPQPQDLVVKCGTPRGIKVGRDFVE